MILLEAKIRAFIVNSLSQEFHRLGIRPEEIAEDINLLGSGSLDSLRFVELISAIESEFDVVVDLEEMDPDDFTTLNGLSRIAARGRT